MSRIAYVNGRYLPHMAARVHIDDRGYQFGDGIYEVCAVRNGRMIDSVPHLDRLERSLREMAMAMPMSRSALECVMRETIRRNLVRDGIVYLQLTRGVAPRDHAFPKHPKTQIVVTARNAKPHSDAMVEDGVKAIMQPDIRWGRCDIKTISLLPNCMAKQAARVAGAYEAILVDDKGVVTEGSSSNAWIVTQDGTLVTRQPTNEILNGITRLEIVKIAKELGLAFEERAFTLDEMRRAREAFVSSASSFAMPITQLDEAPIANGKPGTLSLRLRGAYLAHMDRQAGAA